MPKTILALLLALLLLTGCTTQSPSPNDSDQTDYTAAEVARHNSASSCWMIIRGKVYDVTAYVSRHEGGDEILRGCGLDATAMFESRPEDVADGAGEAHSEDAWRKLAQFYIGELVE